MLNENNNNNKDTKYLKQKKERNLIKFKRFLILLVFATIIAFFASFFFIKYYMVKSTEYHARVSEIKNLEKEKEKLEEDIAILEKKIDYLKTDNGVESVAREKLGLVKPSEIAFVVVDDKNSPNKTSSSKKGKKDTDKDKKEENKNLEVSQKPEKTNWLQLIWNDLFEKSDKKSH